MTFRLRSCLVALLALTLAGCAGRDFTRAAPETLRLGTTTHSEIVGRFGTPYREGTLLKNSQTVKAISYVYSTTGGTPLHEGVTPVRSQAFYFAEQILVGHEFTSSFKDDHTDFPDARVGEIKKGETRESTVVELLGPPTGLYMFPLVTKDHKGLVYVYTQTRLQGFATLKQYQKELIVTVDPGGTVSSVQLNTSGER